MKVKVIDTSGKYQAKAEQLVEERGGTVASGRNFDVLLAFLIGENTQAGFQVAEAAERQRYVLVLVPAGSEDKAGVREDSKFLTLKSFQEENLSRIIKEYLDHRKRGNLKRFNFVIPSEQVQYLEWVAKNKKQSKSDFVRELIQKEMGNDEDYRSNSHINED